MKQFLYSGTFCLTFCYGTHLALSQHCEHRLHALSVMFGDPEVKRDITALRQRLDTIICHTPCCYHQWQLGLSSNSPHIIHNTNIYLFIYLSIEMWDSWWQCQGRCQSWQAPLCVEGQTTSLLRSFVIHLVQWGEPSVPHFAQLHRNTQKNGCIQRHALTGPMWRWYLHTEARPWKRYLNFTLSC